MLKPQSRNPQFESEKSEPQMLFSPEATADEAVTLLEKMVGKRRDKLALNEAAKRISRLIHGDKITPRRVYNIWRKDAKPEAHELLALRAAAGMVQEAKDELAELRSRIARCEAILAVSDADFHCEEIDAVRRLAGDQNRPLARNLGIERPSGLEGQE